MVTLILIAVAVLIVAAIFGTAYMMVADRCLFQRLCAYNSLNALLACLVEVVACICRGFSEN